MTALAIALHVLALPLFGDVHGWVGLQSRAFPQSALDRDQRSGAISLAAELEARWSWDSGRQRFVMKPFARVEAHDGERTHIDVRELYWQSTASRWELTAGVRKIFWGVAESQHLVDIINQTDLVEDPDGEEKLGQPLVSTAVRTAFGRFELIVMPLFRERSFPGARGRLRTIPRVGGVALYEDDGHLDFAGRWSTTLGAWDGGVSHFSGTSREPRFVVVGDTLRPFYLLTDQTSLDLQATHGPLLTKVEAITRRNDEGRHEAATAGFEYTFGGVGARGIDVGVLVEYLYDSRGASAPVAFEDDIFAGSRIALNDTQSTEVLAGAIVDLDTGAAFVNVEASSRIGERWKLNVTARGFRGTRYTDPLHAFRRDGYLEIELVRHFAR